MFENFDRNNALPSMHCGKLVSRMLLEAQPAIPIGREHEYTMAYWYWCIMMHIIRKRLT